MTKQKCDIGLVGLGVMGRNLALNMADHGFSVAVYNRTAQKTRDFINGLEAKQNITPAYSPAELMSLMEKPGAVITLVPAGKPVDAVLDEFKSVMEPGDLLIDSGNSHFTDTDRRARNLAAAGIHFFGMGISGGEKGARYGPSMMAGGPAEAYQRVRPIFEAAAAQVDGEPCVAHLGPGSAGHYVKMVHNGIEYALMQLLSETYDLMKNVAGLDNAQLARVYDGWNKGREKSYLVEITARIFEQRDQGTGNYLVDMILDRAAQKGTGQWTSQDAMELHTPTPTIDEAVIVRNMSTFKAERTQAAEMLTGPSGSWTGRSEEFAASMERAFYCSMILAYAQGLALLRQASEAYHYDLKLDDVARIWRGGCIIRAALLEDIRAAFHKRPDLPNLLLDRDLSGLLQETMADLRTMVKTGIDFGLPVPGLSSALGYLDSYRQKRMPTNLIQAQRDYFGSHTYERIDAEGSFHTQWETGQEDS